MDESAIYLDAPSSYTYACKGSRRVKATTTGNEKTRLSAAFTASADGCKLPVFAIVPRVTRIEAIDALPDVTAEYKTSSTFDDEMIIKYLSRVVISYMTRRNFSTVLLLIDSARCHLTAKVKQFCIQNCIELLIIPPRMTYLLQPADVCWFAPVKKALKKEWDNWYINDTNLHTYTAANNMRLVCYCNVILSYLQTSNYQILIKVTRLFKMS